MPVNGMEQFSETEQNKIGNIVHYYYKNQPLYSLICWYIYYRIYARNNKSILLLLSA